MPKPNITEGAIEPIRGGIIDKTGEFYVKQNNTIKFMCLHVLYIVIFKPNSIAKLKTALQFPRPKNRDLKGYLPGI